MKLIKFILILLILFYGAKISCADECEISVTSLHFATYYASSPAPLESIGNITVSCATVSDFIVKIDQGIHSNGSFHPRTMISSSGSDRLNYNLYIDPNHSLVWGDGTDNTYTQAGISNLTVYGIIMPFQNVELGLYTDTVIVSVEW